MSEVLIDVAWRGLEVGRQVPLHELTDDHGRVDVALPMPVGTTVSVRTGDGLEIPAVVSRVHEQSSSGGETAGMVLSPQLDDRARAWWSARVAERADEVPTPSTASAGDEPAVMIVAAADPTARPTMVYQAMSLADIAAVPTAASPTPTPVAAPVVAPAPAPVVAPPVSPAPPIVHAPPTAVLPTVPRAAISDTDASAAISQLPTAALSPEDLHAARAAAIADAAADLAGALSASEATAEPPGPPPLPGDGRRTELMPALVADEPSEPAGEVPDDTSRTAIMTAVDIEAIMADSAASPASGDDDDSGTVAGEVTGEVSGEVSGDANGPRGKRKGPRGKRRTKAR